jgi:outer membrane protein OmpA-like peptidoglycan-associated protein
VSGYPYRLQTLWITLLALAWLGLCSPWTVGLKVLLTVLTVGVAPAALVWVTRRAQARRRATAHTLAAMDATLHILPGDLKRHTPLVIAVGDPLAMASVWGDTRVRMTDAALWVRCDDPPALMHLADALKRWRGGQGPDAVVCLMAADGGEADTQAAAWKAWMSAVNAASRAVGYALPMGVAVMAHYPDDGEDTCPWLGISGSVRLDVVDMPTLLRPLLEHYAMTALPTAQGTVARRTALLDALTRWAAVSIWPLWADRRSAPRVMAFGVTTVRGSSSSRSPFGRFVTQITALVSASADELAQSPVPLPDELLAGMPRQPVRRTWPRALAHAAIALAVFFMIGAAASAWQNRTLMQRLAEHVARYQAVLPTQDAARVDALATIKRDRDTLEHYASAGVPLRLGFGLYRGAPWLPLTAALIANYQPPALPPSMIELDSMSLFKSGSAVLNPGSNRVLVAALNMIKAHPDKRVLIAGHTDAVGNPIANLKLSEARAAAVRDWLIDASGLAPTRFAIQGYGDTRPKSANDTDAGRAANRRVEITLVPDCRNDSGNPTPPGRPACSSEGE